MNVAPYTLVVGSLMYAMICTRQDIYYLVGMVNRYQSNPGPEYWTTVKHIFKDLRKTWDFMLTYGCSNLILVDFTDSDFMSDMDFRKSLSDMCSFC